MALTAGSSNGLTPHWAWTSLTTQLTNASGNASITVASTVPLGTSVYDTSSITPSANKGTPTGWVIYSFYDNTACSGTAASTDHVNLNSDGSVPNAAASGPLGAGSYAFQANYSGDTNYDPSTSSCEDFWVGTGSSTTATWLVNNATWATIPDSSTVPLGTVVYDTSQVTPSPTGPTPTGTVMYNFFDNSTCSAPPASSQTVTLNGDGSVPDSNDTVPLTAGNYAYDAVYSGDSNYTGSTSPCEPFTVSSVVLTSTSVATTLVNTVTWATIPDDSTVPIGTSVYDTATVTAGTGSPVPTGTVTYRFFDNSTCTGTIASSQTVNLSANGSVPDSSDSAPLTGGSYAFDASYSGDSNYTGSTSPCEPFTVSSSTLISTTVATTLKNASGGATIADDSTVAQGTSVSDTSTVTPTSGTGTPTGSVTYSFFDNSDCWGTTSSTQKLNLNGDGSVPDSSDSAALGTGSYSFDATYSGDSNYSGSTSSCEPFSVNSSQPPTSVTTTVYDASTNAAWSGTETPGASAYDTSSVGGEVGSTVPTGTVTYSFFYTSDCTATPFSTDKVTLSAGKVPDSSTLGPLGEGSYAFQASYSGDSNYGGSSSPCEPFSVGEQPGGKVELFVTPAPIGTDGINRCTLAMNPCATIAHALTEEALLSNGAEGSVIKLSKGTFDAPASVDPMFAALGVGNDDVTITGVSAKKTIIIPQSCSALGEATVGPDAGDFAMVAFENQTSADNSGDAVNGVTVENVTLDGSLVTSCPNYTAAVLATNGDSGNAVVDSNIEGGATYGVLMDDNSFSTIISNTMTPSPLCSGSVKGPDTGLNGGWTTPADLVVTKIPKCARPTASGRLGFTGVSINGITYCATLSTTSKTLVLTGVAGSSGCPGGTPITSPGGVEIPKGAVVDYNTSTVPFTKYGIACNGLGETAWDTDCAISDNVITGGNTTYSDVPVGILVTGDATASVDGNTVSGMSDLNKDGIGIGLLPDTTEGQTAGTTTVGVNELTSPVTGTGNTLSGNDNGIVAEACAVVTATCPETPNSTAVWGINSNTVGANDLGMQVEGVETGMTLGSIGISANKVENVLTGVGLWLSSDTQAAGADATCSTPATTFCVGGHLGTLGNTLNGNDIGLDMNGGTSGITVANNTVDGNVIFGVLLSGANAFPELGQFGGTDTTSANTFSDNTWTGNGTRVTGVNGGANIIDFTGFCGQNTSPCDNPSVGGSAPTLGTSSPGCLYLATSIPAGFGSSAGTIQLVDKCSVSPEPLGPGTLVDVTGYVNGQGDDVSLFVTQAASVANAATTVSVAAIIPADGVAANTVASGPTVSVTANDQPGFATNPPSANTYGSGNSCGPIAPNVSTTLTAGTGGGAPNTTSGGETGYDAC